MKINEKKWKKMKKNKKKWKNFEKIWEWVEIEFFVRWVKFDAKKWGVLLDEN